MSHYTAKRLREMEAGFGGGFVKVRAELGVSAFGMQVIQLPPAYSDYPEHDHADSGQEEVFVAIGGSGWIDIEGERVELDGETFVRVGAGAKRKVYAGPEGLRVLVIGGAPGKVYEAPEVTELTGSAA
jgi:quercetin dioxygenase-like cupin family protein